MTVTAPPDSVLATPEQIFQALGDPTRRALFETLSRDGERNVRALTATAGVSQPMVSRHLAILQRAKLVAARRQGRETHFTATPDGLVPLAGWLMQKGGFWNAQMGALAQLTELTEQAA